VIQNPNKEAYEDFHGSRAPRISSRLGISFVENDRRLKMTAKARLTRTALGSLINRPVTFRTIARFWHPRTGITAFLLLLYTTTELVVLNLIPQHDPQPRLASERLCGRIPPT
jgi:hypothetical protein